MYGRSLCKKHVPSSAHIVFFSVADPDPGSGAFNTPGSGNRIRDENFRSYFRELRNNLLGKNTLILWCGCGSGNLFDPGSGIRNGKNSAPGSGINIPDSQHWFSHNILLSTVTAEVARYVPYWYGSGICIWATNSLKMPLKFPYNGQRKTPF